MKQWLVAAPVLLGMACAARAQEPALPSLTAIVSVSANLAAHATPSAAADAMSDSVFAQPSENLSAAFASENSGPADPGPAGETRSRSGDVDGHRLEMGLGYAFVKFRSSPINAAMNGLNSEVAYFPKSNFGIEANATTSFGPHEIFDREHPKFLYYGAGGKYVEHRATWDPWAHVLAGGVHMFPQTAAGSMNGLAVKFGGGVDYHRDDSRISLRLEGDFIRSQLYSQGQNNFMFATSFVIR